MKKFFLKLADLRVVDGYIGLFGVIVWLHVWAKYHLSIEIVYLSIRAWKWTPFSLSLTWHTLNRKTSTFSFYPPVTFRLSLLGHNVIDTGADAAKRTSEKVDQYMAKDRARKAEEARLIDAAKAAGL